jgi:hypothetical protein
LRRNPGLDIKTVQDAGLSGATDIVVLEWTARENRVLLTHDVSTITKYAYARVKAQLPMPAIFEVPQTMSVGAAIEDILLLAECSLDDEWAGQIRYLPL